MKGMKWWKIIVIAVKGWMCQTIIAVELYYRIQKHLVYWSLCVRVGLDPSEGSVLLWSTLS
jgi:hypothetical protein